MSMQNKNEGIGTWSANKLIRINVYKHLANKTIANNFAQDLGTIKHSLGVLYQFLETISKLGNMTHKKRKALGCTQQKGFSRGIVVD